MPRLDNTDPYVLDFFCLEEDNEEVLDVCIDCVEDFEVNGVNTEVEHPHYEDDEEGFYSCVWCGDNLYERDN